MLISCVRTNPILGKRSLEASYASLPQIFNTAISHSSIRTPATPLSAPS